MAMAEKVDGLMWVLEAYPKDLGKVVSALEDTVAVVSALVDTVNDLKEEVEKLRKEVKE